jgi:hypothetical protein
MGTLIVFGPDLPPLETGSASEGSPAPRRRRDAIAVQESPQDAAGKLAASSTPWPRFTHEHGPRKGRPIYVNPAAVRYLVESG